MDLDQEYGDYGIIGMPFLIRNSVTEIVVMIWSIVMMEYSRVCNLRLKTI